MKYQDIVTATAIKRDDATAAAAKETATREDTAARETAARETAIEHARLSAKIDALVAPELPDYGAGYGAQKKRSILGTHEPASDAVTAMLGNLAAPDNQKRLKRERWLNARIAEYSAAIDDTELKRDAYVMQRESMEYEASKLRAERERQRAWLHNRMNDLARSIEDFNDEIVRARDVNNVSRELWLGKRIAELSRCRAALNAERDALAR